MKLFKKTPDKDTKATDGPIKRVLAITGAGISRESNIPTFRDTGGIWTKYNPFEFATAEAIQANLNRVWAWTDKLRLELADAKPNKAHLLLAKLEMYYDVLVCTQNIDGLHQMAGSSKVIEIHGNYARARCESCGTKWQLPETPLFEKRFYAAFDPPDSALPCCPACQAVGRPDVVLFNETYGPEIDDIGREIRQGTDLVIIVGTSGTVPTPYYLALDAYRFHQCPVIDINPGETLNDSYHLFPSFRRLYAPATEGMQMVWDILAELRQQA